MTIRDQFRHARAVYRNHDQLVELQDQYHDAPDTATRLAVTERRALLDVYGGMVVARCADPKALWRGIGAF